MELKVEEIKALEPIKFNYEELKKWLEEKVKNYKNLVYTDENIGTAKSDRADLNKLKKALNDEKIRIKKTWLTPYDVFETKIKDLIRIVDVAVENVDTQVKSYEQKEKDKKTEEILNYFVSKVGKYKDVLDFDEIFNQKWLNKTCKMNDIKKEIDTLIARIDTHMQIIDGQVQDENMNTEIRRYYFEHVADENVLTFTMAQIQKIEEENKKINTLKQKEIPKITESLVNNEENLQNVEKEENSGTTEVIAQFNFRVWVNAEQAQKLKAFLVENEIKFERLVLNNGNS